MNLKKLYQNKRHKKLDMKQRVIKFRAWDTQEKKMCGDLMDFAQTSIMMNWGNPWNDPRFVPLQFTGLTDANDVEIYEGDIVKVRNVGQIVFRAGAFHVSYGANGEPLGWILQIRIEVIGNVYQTPNLLSA